MNVTGTKSDDIGSLVAGIALLVYSVSLAYSSGDPIRWNIVAIFVGTSGGMLLFLVTHYTAVGKQIDEQLRRSATLRIGIALLGIFVLTGVIQILEISINAVWWSGVFGLGLSLVLFPLVKL